MADATQERVIAKTARSGKLTDLTNAPNAIYRGEQTYFCAMACLRAFEQKIRSSYGRWVSTIRPCLLMKSLPIC
jgi:YHS domain-containing protein